MDMYSISDCREWGAGIHDIDVHVDELRALRCQDRSAQYPASPGVGDNFDETSRLADLVGLAVLGHVEGRDLDIYARGPRLFLGHAHDAHLGIDENGIRYHAIRGPRSVARKLGHQNSIVIP